MPINQIDGCEIRGITIGLLDDQWAGQGVAGLFEVFDQPADGLVVRGAFRLVGPLVKCIAHRQRQALAFLDMRLQGKQALAEQALCSSRLAYSAISSLRDSL